MTAALVTITVDDAAVLAKLRQLADRASNLETPMREIGEHLLESTRHRFSTQIGPQGEPWPAVTPAYAARKLGGKVTSSRGDAKSRDPSQLLLLTHHLFDNLSYQADGKSVTLGSPEVYAATHQFGRGPIPARPFLGVSQDDQAIIVEIIEGHLLDD